jgi:26S proteasome regulatory subunit N3
MTILNLLLRNYLDHSLYTQADKLSSKSSRVVSMLSDGSVSNNQIARYLHYQVFVVFCLKKQFLKPKTNRDASRQFSWLTALLLSIWKSLCARPRAKQHSDFVSPRKKKGGRELFCFVCKCCLFSHKLLIIVQLLMGEIPERGVFEQNELAKELRPYFLLARAVRLGDLESYNKAVATYSAQFTRDDTVNTPTNKTEKKKENSHLFLCAVGVGGSSAT